MSDEHIRAQKGTGCIMEMGSSEDVVPELYQIGAEHMQVRNVFFRTAG